MESRIIISSLVAAGPGVGRIETDGQHTKDRVESQINQQENIDAVPGELSNGFPSTSDKTPSPLGRARMVVLEGSSDFLLAELSLLVSILSH